MGLSHNTATVDVREAHTFPAHTMGEALIALRDYSAVREALMLQTCGRLEIYAEIEDYEEGVGQIRQFLGNFRHGDVADMDSYLYTLLGSQAIDHLFRVSTGLDSMLIGEAEILHQVKDAFIQGQRAQSLGKTLHSLFREAINAGKSARSQTDIGGQSTSIATAAVNAAIGHVGDLRGTSVVVVGAGKMGSLVARRLKSAGCGDIVVLNRSSQRARDVVDAIGTGRTMDMPGIVDAVRDADIVVTSTGAPSFVLTMDNVRDAMATRPNRPLFIVDIAVPRDCDPDVATIDGVSVVDVDGLRDVVDITLERRREAIPMVEEIIAEHTERFHNWYQARVAVPVISSLTQRAESIRESELERLFARCPELSDRERMLITGMSLTIISKLLHNAIAKIRDKAIVNHAEALTDAHILNDLFDLRAHVLEESGVGLLPEAEDARE
jgi:glutamyl-tRNA reductase